MTNLRPLGEAGWRRQNRAYRSDVATLLQRIRDVASVIYADPPYTSDHYSRYYHLWETLLLYDYPEPSGKGQYRPNRFVSQFSTKTKVRGAFEELITSAAKLKTSLVINYPENGLLPEARDTLLSLLHTYFNHAEIACEVQHEHSTLGASKGIERAPVTELIFFAQ